ncbi:gamma-glutamyltransferase [miscellaneous Crenarchaeota group-15 archaeon DG-45]|uniref:Gamma-glutamyltransferase n=1 Tax=miscellaneous Crenarchaeota group-15 archaeon DG-45 TaxID=1685127 RepID=A0A0M0BNE0_9ARCH|nr:MAG: gamma-glutamyltransferase [miscellaneous Crenarchaeota group-15 archaeon DG-45]
MDIDAAPKLKPPSDLLFKTHKREVAASRGVVAANHPLASAAGVEAIARGGNAFDGAVAALFALTVVEPMMVGIFGAGFFVLRVAETGNIETVDNYATAPKAATEDMYVPLDRRQPGQYLFEAVGRKNTVGHLSVATPGALKAWEHVVEEHGALGLAEVMEPAIRFARGGFRASPYLVHCIESARSDLELFPETAAVFLPGGSPPTPGDIIVMPEYAETLEKIARGGSDVLYRGELARAVVDDMEGNGGILALDDLAEYELIMRRPIRGKYRGSYEVYSVSPVSSGGAHIVQMLNILERFDVASLGFGSPGHLHLLAEALKMAFADRQQYMGDPERVLVPVAGLTSKRYAGELAKRLSIEAAGRYSPGEPMLFEGGGEHTTHVSAMDSDGNMVAATQTIHQLFGSKVTTPGTGMLLNDCMCLFDPRPGRANSVAGGKRMLSSMSPTVVLRDGDPFMCLGTPGGTRIFASVCQAIVNVVDFGMTIQQAVEAPRIWTMGIPGTDGEKLHVEPGFPEETLDGLRARGHEVVEMPRIAGGMNGILVDPVTGLMHGGACWRADGTPMGVSGGLAHPRAMEPTPPV